MRPSVDVSLHGPWYSQAEQYLSHFNRLTEFAVVDPIDVPFLDGVMLCLLPLIGYLITLAFKKFVSRGLFPGEPEQPIVAKHGQGVPPGYSIYWRFVAVTAQIE